MSDLNKPWGEAAEPPAGGAMPAPPPPPGTTPAQPSAPPPPPPATPVVPEPPAPVAPAQAAPPPPPPSSGGFETPSAPPPPSPSGGGFETPLAPPPPTAPAQPAYGAPPPPSQQPAPQPVAGYQAYPDTPPPGGYAQTSAVGEYASIIQRFAAIMIDGLLLALFYLPAVAVGAALIAVLPREERGLCEDFDGDLYSCEPFTDSSTAILFGVVGLLGLLAIIAQFWYWGKYEGRQGQTIGKRTMGIKTVDINTGQPIGFGKAIGRLFARNLSAFFCYIGYFWMLWDKQSQTFHDKILSSVVVKA